MMLTGIAIFLSGLLAGLLLYPHLNEERRYLKRIAWYRQNKNCVSPENDYCPECGFYCLGRGGISCIDKPRLCGYDIK